MRRAILSPLLSALVIPGLGQLVNRQIAKGAFLVAAVSLLFMVGLGFALHQVTSAITTLDAKGGLKPGDFGALSEQLRAQGGEWLLVFLGLLLALWAYAVIDAWRGGRARDAELARREAGRTGEM